MSQNRLAAEYMWALLRKDSTIRLLRFGDLSQNGVPSRFVLVVDNCGALPLSEHLRVMKNRYPLGRFMVLDRAKTKEELVGLVLQGVHGFLNHAEIQVRISEAIHAVASGALYFPEEVLQHFVQYTTQNRRERGLTFNILTARESQILELVERRLSNNEIAVALGIQSTTVKYHLTNIFSKLQIEDRRAVIRRYEESVSPDTGALAASATGEPKIRQCGEHEGYTLLSKRRELSHKAGART